MSRCVPNWDLHDEEATAWGHPPPSFIGPDIPSVDNEVAELTWENGQLSLNGLGQLRMNSKTIATAGTLESLMNQAVPISGCKPSFACAADLVPWFNPSQAQTDVVAAASGAMMMDALVPCAAAASDDPRRQAVWLLADSAGGGTGECVCCSTRVGSCSGDVLLRPAEGSSKRMRGHGSCGEWEDHQSVSGSATFSHHVTTLDVCEHERESDNATSEGSPENTQSGKVGAGRVADTTTDEHDSDYSRPQRAEGKKTRIGKSSLSTKRSRAASIHNQSERKRRDKINQKMKTLQKLLPNSSKTDKASVLDEVIDYLKQLQAQVQLMSRMNMMPQPTPLMLPLALHQQQPQQLQMSMMASPILGLGLTGMPGIFSSGDMTAALGVAGRPNIPGIPPVPAFLHPFMPMNSWDGTLGSRFPPTVSSPSPVMPDPFSVFLASQSPPNVDMQAMALDAYSRLAAMYHHHHQQQQQQTQNPNN